MEQFEVLGIITQILLHNSSHCFFGFNILLLLTFDECHYAQVESNHSFAEIMKVYTVESREELDQFVSSPQINYYYYGDFVERNDVIEQNEQCSDDVLCGSYLSLVAASFLTQCKKEGVEKLCSDLGVEHTDVRVLMLAWKMNAKKQGYFTQDEWRTGLTSLHADNLKKLKKQLSELQKEVAKKEKFEDFYRFSFTYCLTEDKQKSLDIETACVLLDLVLGPNFNLQADSFIKYLKVQKEYKVINMDQWMNFYRFCQEIEFPDLSNYDDCLAWPIILDNFVVWVKKNLKCGLTSEPVPDPTGELAQPTGSLEGDSHYVFGPVNPPVPVRL
ncbi:hypothetical protein R6Q59_004736 [Mikania micrantha]